ncbi:hypothetical protein L596_014080 [Steinernema carpocapsae]|uniref:Uncharacterized protein n=1 Tax=Steinernema carpocapsae TaxID=34508 RepID=A0A4U5NBP3_STECR|nr:hypothetical protein L596_014080 [Steinernema carpocapsae]
MLQASENRLARRTCLVCVWDANVLVPAVVQLRLVVQAGSRSEQGAAAPKERGASATLTNEKIPSPRLLTDND